MNLGMPSEGGRVDAGEGALVTDISLHPVVCLSMGLQLILSTEGIETQLTDVRFLPYTYNCSNIFNFFLKLILL
jgi:hypothetical protein